MRDRRAFQLVVACGVASLGGCDEILDAYVGDRGGDDVQVDADLADSGRADASTTSDGDDDGGGEAGDSEASTDGGDATAEIADCDCRDGEVCVSGMCMCAPGTTLVDGACQLAPDVPPAERQVDDVCSRWFVGAEPAATTVFHTSDDTCDAGRIDADAHDDAMRRLNYFRWLVGLEPATVDAANVENAQAAAALFARNGAITHTPPATWTCYSEQAAIAAERSSISIGVASPVVAVDAYIEDAGVDTLAHRRALLLPNLDRVGIGHYADANAIWTFDETSRTPPPFVAYPPPGPSPSVAVMGEWSFAAEEDVADAIITATDTATGRPYAVEQRALPPAYGQDAIAFSLTPRPLAGEAVTIRVEGTHVSTSYDVTVVSCAAWLRSTAAGPASRR